MPIIGAIVKFAPAGADLSPDALGAAGAPQHFWGASQANLDDKSQFSESLQRQQGACYGLGKKGDRRERSIVTMLTILRITFFAILLLTGCENRQPKNPIVGQIQQIESPLQNTAEGMAKACFTKGAGPKRCRPDNLQPNDVALYLPHD
jgi:hypothetical protein